MQTFGDADPASLKWYSVLRGRFVAWLRRWANQALLHTSAQIASANAMPER